jgi:hypothetical protein
MKTEKTKKIIPAATDEARNMGPLYGVDVRKNSSISVSIRAKPIVKRKPN